MKGYGPSGEAFGAFHGWLAAGYGCHDKYVYTKTDAAIEKAGGMG